MQTDFPFTRDLVFIGGGHSHALALRRWAMLPLPGVRVTLIDPAPRAAYSGMLPGFVAGHYTRDELDIDLVRLARFAGARLVLGAVTHIDRAAREIHVPGRPPIAYDVCAIDVGITSTMAQIKGFAEHAVPAKPLTPFAHKWETYRNTEGPKKVAIIGGGVAGVELAMAMAHALTGRAAQITVIDRSTALKEATPKGRTTLRAALSRLGVELLEDANAVEVLSEGVRLADGRLIASDFTVGAAGATPHSWMQDIGVDMTDGFITVDEHLQTSDPAIFATGDCAHLSHAPRPKAGVYAVRQAPILFDNLVAALSSGQMRAYWPQSDYLKLISLGEQRAMAEKWGTAFTGRALWTLKNRIDQKFMDRFRDLPAMDNPPLPRTRADGLAEALGSKPMCGGCGAKVGRAALHGALSRLPPPARPDVQRLPGDDAAMLRIGKAQQVISTDHLRAVTADPALMTRIAAIHALGDVWGMGAAPQSALATVILPRGSDQIQGRMLSEIMAVAQDVMSEAGAEIVGGHTTMGAELTIGFAVTGLLDGTPLTLSGAAPDQAIVLTKPIGSGTILAAEMRMAAPGDVVAACYQAMVQEQGVASRILAKAGATAMTDVTGFGLAGHLDGLCRASEVSAQVRLSDVPLMKGALDLALAGEASSLLPTNRADMGHVDVPETPLGHLMFDPQTAGGLLATVPKVALDSALSALHDAGYEAAHIGMTGTGPARLSFD